VGSLHESLTAALRTVPLARSSLPAEPCGSARFPPKGRVLDPSSYSYACFPRYCECCRLACCTYTNVSDISYTHNRCTNTHVCARGLRYAREARCATRPHGALAGCGVRARIPN
jgi:hypothetical protein